MKRIISIITIIVLPVFVFLFIFQTAVFDLDYFEKNFIENNTMEITGLNFDQLMRVSNATLEYLEDERDDLILFEEIDGERIQVFGERELSHMRDVKKLFLYGFEIMYITMGLSIACLVYLYIRDKRLVYKSVMISSILFLLASGAITVLAYVDFNGVFVVFHKILFSNDLWLLDPKEDIMIQMLPLDFFMGIGIKTAVMYLGYLLITFVASAILLRGYRYQN